MNGSPGLIYMLNGAVQHSYTDPFDRTWAAIGPNSGRDAASKSVTSG